jgi:hypothetical protein
MYKSEKFTVRGATCSKAASSLPAFINFTPSKEVKALKLSGKGGPSATFPDIVWRLLLRRSNLSWKDWRQATRRFLVNCWTIKTSVLNLH